VASSQITIGNVLRRRRSRGKGHISRNVKMSVGIWVHLDNYCDISLICDQIIEFRKLGHWMRRLGRPLGVVGTVARLPELGSNIVIVCSRFQKLLLQLSVRISKGRPSRISYAGL